MVLFGVSLVVFSFVVRQAVAILPYLIASEPIPLTPLLYGAGWLALFVLSFLGTGFFLYERERDEGRASRRIPMYDWLLDRRNAEGSQSPTVAKPIRRA